jgi:hypothetical protein
MYARGPSNYRGGGGGGGDDEGGRGGYNSPTQQHTTSAGGASPYRNSPSSNASSSPNSQRTFSNWGSSNSSSRKTSYESNTYTPPNKRNPSHSYNKPPPAPTAPYDSNQKPLSNTKGGYSVPNNGGVRKGKGALSTSPQKPQQRDSVPIGKKPAFVSGSISKPTPAARSGPRAAASEERGHDNRPTGRSNNINDKARNGTKLNMKGISSKAEDGSGKSKNNGHDVQVRPDQNFVPRGMVAPTDGSGQPFAYYPMEGYYSMPVMGSYPYGPGYFPGGLQFQPMGDGLVGWQPGPMYYGYYNQEMPDENDDDDDDDKVKKESGDEEQED